MGTKIILKSLKINNNRTNYFSKLEHLPATIIVIFLFNAGQVFNKNMIYYVVDFEGVIIVWSIIIWNNFTNNVILG